MMHIEHVAFVPALDTDMYVRFFCRNSRIVVRAIRHHLPEHDRCTQAVCSKSTSTACKVPRVCTALEQTAS